ncbi:hypothetical protein A5624_26675 [Mycobacterium sp. 1482292.6]|nr:hypothetical protein A5624_26675 [Mycobacterium sp. 1482292.6]OBJ16848.1 hypothetical protein A5622_24630 [Mycobacterium sp. 1245801.1]
MQHLEGAQYQLLTRPSQWIAFGEEKRHPYVVPRLFQDAERAEVVVGLAAGVRAFEVGTQLWELGQQQGVALDQVTQPIVAGTHHSDPRLDPNQLQLAFEVKLGPVNKIRDGVVSQFATMCADEVGEVPVSGLIKVIGVHMFTGDKTS